MVCVQESQLNSGTSDKVEQCAQPGCTPFRGCYQTEKYMTMQIVAGELNSHMTVQYQSRLEMVVTFDVVQLLARCSQNTINGVGSACTKVNHSTDQQATVLQSQAEMDRPPPGTIKQGYLTTSPPLAKRGIKVRHHSVYTKRVSCLAAWKLNA